MKATLKRKKSISSQAASISAWWAVFDWPSIVAAFSVSRHGPASSSAARRKTAARSSHGTRCQSSHASADALIAASTSVGAALVDVGEDVLLVVRHDRLAQSLPVLHVLAADDERDLDALVPHLLAAAAGGSRAPGEPGRVVADRARSRAAAAEDARGAHDGAFYGAWHGRGPYDVPALGGRRALTSGPTRLVYHELPRAGSTTGDQRRASAGRAGPRLLPRRATSLRRRRARGRVGDAVPAAIADALRGVPWGEVVTYGELAALAGTAGAPRAAGTFCAENNFPLVVPCHRVVSSAGLGGYGSLGVEYKRRLLALEGVDL